MEQMPQHLFKHYFMVSANRNPKFSTYVFEITIIVYATETTLTTFSFTAF